MAATSRLGATRATSPIGSPLSSSDSVSGSQGRCGSAGRLNGGELTSVANKARRLLQGLALDPPARYARYMSWFQEAQRTALYTDDFAALASRSQTSEVIADPWREASGQDVVDVMLEVDTTTYLPGDLIPKIDIATMAYALEARSPFLDHELMEFAASIPGASRCADPRRSGSCARRFADWLPDDILDRPKQGFTVPIGHWLRNELRHTLRDVLLDPRSLGRGYFKEDAVESMIDRHDAGASTRRRNACGPCSCWSSGTASSSTGSAPLGRSGASPRRLPWNPGSCSSHRFATRPPTSSASSARSPLRSGGPIAGW